MDGMKRTGSAEVIKCDGGYQAMIRVAGDGLSLMATRPDPISALDALRESVLSMFPDVRILVSMDDGRIVMAYCRDHGHG